MSKRWVCGGPYLWLSVLYIITIGHVSVFIVVVGSCAQEKHFPKLLWSLRRNDTNYGKVEVVIPQFHEE